MKKLTTLSIVFICVFLAFPTVSFGFSLSDLFSNNKAQSSHTDRIDAWEQLITEAKNDSEWQMINRVNLFFNKIQYIPDTAHWGKVDYWATPLEFISSNAGDCEDFAIAKYYTLRAMGMDDSRLRLTHVTITSTGEAHMVLLVRELNDSTYLTLDNRQNTISAFSSHADLVPVYSFNMTNLWITKAKQKYIKVGKASQIGNWTKLNRRIKMENSLASLIL